MAAADVTSLQTIRTQILARITDLTAGVYPDVSDQGRSVSTGSLLTNLFKQLEQVEAAIQATSGPFVVVTHGRPV